jgi:hypothetical protein
MLAYLILVSVKWTETGMAAPATGIISYAESATAAKSKPFRSARYLPGHFLPDIRHKVSDNPLFLSLTFDRNQTQMIRGSESCHFQRGDVLA